MPVSTASPWFEELITALTEDSLVLPATDIAFSATESPLMTLRPLLRDVTNATNKSDVIMSANRGPGVFESQIIIPLYVVIFLLAVVGNSLVLITLAQNKRMRTVTNVYLLNLAVSDLLLGVFCMPFTLVGHLLRNFIFGATMCKLIPYFQAVSVSVGVWTLVAISLERYFAICRPLKSRRWQTQFHAYKMIAVVWAASLLWNAPILAVSTLKAMRDRGHHKCREEWPSKGSERAYNLFLDAALLLAPLLIMGLAYSLIVSKLWRGLRREMHSSSCQKQLERSGSSATMNGVALANSNSEIASCNTVITPIRQHHVLQSPRHLTIANGTAANGNGQRNGAGAHIVTKGRSGNGSEAVKLWLFKGMVQVRLPSGTPARACYRPTSTLVPPRCTFGPGVPPEAELLSPATDDPPVDTTYTFSRHAIRSNYMDKSIEAKKKVIRMLFVIIAEFFVCWAPLHVLNTVYLFAPELLYNHVSSTGVALVQLLAYISSCCNPITYCFMNRRFRQAFLGVFDCYRCWRLYCCCGKVGSDNLGSHHRGLNRNGHLGCPAGLSDASGGESTVYVARQSTLGRSEVVVLEAEDRV